MRCPYRADKECNQTTLICKFCILGQIADEQSIMNSAIANLTASIKAQNK